MTHISKLRAVAVISSLMLLGSAAVAEAGERLTVYTDHSRILNVERAPGTVIVGNPSIADVTISQW